MRDPCPFLPEASPDLRAAGMRRHGTARGRAFYRDALRIAQSLWLQGLPAQSLLLINRAMGAAFPETAEELAADPVPYEAVGWILAHREDGDFIGNPRRHYQHLATRMVPPRLERRRARAWACWWLACRILPECPPDVKQIAEEGVVEPGYADILDLLVRNGVPGEASGWTAATNAAGPGLFMDPRGE